MNQLTILALCLTAFICTCTASAKIGSISSSKEQPGNEASQAFDQSASTRWSAQGQGAWIQCEFEAESEVAEVGIGFQSAERNYAFILGTSLDGEKWETTGRLQSQSRSGVVTYKITPRKARLLRLTVFGSNENDWANVHTIHIPGVTAGPASGQNSDTKPEFVVTEWATDPSIANTVAISVDDKGRAYVTAARRRKQSSLDIRNHQDLVKKDLSLSTVEERRAWYREYLTGKKWIPDRNGDGTRNWKDLTVQKDSVIRVADEDGDGKGETLRTLDEYHTEVTGIAAGVLAVGSDVFVAAEPDFLRYQDADGDGFPERRRVVATGFQVHMGQGGHNLSGVTLGPDGRVYWSLGDKGHYVETKEGKVYHQPNSGGIFRCELDGSQVERYSSGERNAQELAFDLHGNLFSMDNDGDYPGEKERALYITEGSEHGWRLNWQWLRKQDFTRISGIPAYNPWMDEQLFLPDRADHAAYLTPTIGNFGPGPCGFTANPGTALSPDLSDCFFMTNQQGQVRVFRFIEKGAAFEFEEQAAIKGGRSNTGLAVGPDGALYSACYGGSKGSIFRFDVTKEHQHPARKETQEILPRSSEEATRNTLQAWLGHPDQSFRMKGQFELARREMRTAFKEVLDEKSSSRLARLHAIWGIGQISRRSPGALTLLNQAWSSSDPEIIAQCAKVAGDIPGHTEEVEGLGKHLLTALAHKSPRVQFFAAISLGKHKIREAAPALIELAANEGSRDPYLRHAAMMGLKGALTPEQLAELHNHEHRTVRLAAIVALRNLKAPAVSSFLEDKDELILLEAARAIHDDQSIPEALPALSRLLDRPGLTNEALMRRVINAAFRVGSYPALLRIEAYLKRNEGSAKMKRTALASLLWWSQPPVLDAVEGRYRKHTARDSKPVNEAVTRLKPIIMADNELREVLLNGVSVRGEASWLEGTSEHFDKLAPALQVKVLEGLARINSPDLRKFVEAALSSDDLKVQEKARDYASKAGVPMLDLLLSILEKEGSNGKGKAIKQLANEKDPRAKSKFAALVEEFRQGKAAPEWKLELWQAARAREIQLPETPDLLEYGGDAQRGREIVFNHAASQCIRCHKLGKEGGKPSAEITIGPELTRIGKLRDRRHLVASLLTPSSEISDGFGTVVLKTTEGEEISGILTKKTNLFWTITLATGKKRNLRPDEISSHILVSTMPPMGSILKPEEIRDVVEFLAGQK
ncbi:MAG TPA: hypothetical protein DCQ96_03900 [Verrucomicrobiales bacterium]|nr:hypothetical protein [Verrucomicrobiales bacterium]